MYTCSLALIATSTAALALQSSRAPAVEIEGARIKGFQDRFSDALNSSHSGDLAAWEQVQPRRAGDGVPHALREGTSQPDFVADTAIGLAAERSCSPGQPRIPPIDPLNDEEHQNEQEIRKWWQQPIRRCEHFDDHWAKDYMPKDLRAFWFESNATREAFAPAQYTHAWRHDSLLRVLVAWKHLMARLHIQYWLHAGALISIGRYHGKHMIPWDYDADVAMTDADKRKLNSTLYSPDRKVLGKISPGELGLPLDMVVYTFGRETSRMTHTGSGLYVDVFTFRKEGNQFKWWNDDRTVQESAIFPLTTCVLQGVGHLPCPHNVTAYNSYYGNVNNPDFHWNNKTKHYVR